MGTGGGKGEEEAHWFGGAEGRGRGTHCLGGGEGGGQLALWRAWLETLASAQGD